MAQAKKPETQEKETEAKTKKKQTKHAEVIAEAVPANATTDGKLEIKEDKPAAKAGKRSAKSVAEVQKKQLKESRKNTPVAEKSAKESKPSRSRVERAGKRYRQATQMVDKSKSYPLAEALDLAVKTSNTKFDAAIEMHINLGVDPRQADQNVRGTVALPAGTGKNIRVATLADDAQAEQLFAKLDKEDIDFDVLIATPEMMPKLAKYARLLGPRGLMPSPKSGTVTQEVTKAAEEAKAGRVEYRVDQAGIIHLSIGKASFGPSKLTDNADAVLSNVRSAKPASLKGIYIKSAYVSSTMGPSVRLEM